MRQSSASRTRRDRVLEVRYFSVESGRGPFDTPSKGVTFAGLFFGRKRARPFRHAVKGVTFAGSLPGNVPGILQEGFAMNIRTAAALAALITCGFSLPAPADDSP